ncbi:MoxR family ATPase [Methylobacterium sp. AMS5]|uniref:AAA family ATPase n=1 Tax=Methylobacterium sp. AMS5 TaxID=925818 RepID=UPI00074F8245|nr:MoxR family ATPase [Methylobacterium sp. AMS5]AMB48377.1 porphyrin biosynthesis protein [Methylobacterium sp. AMS5]
MSAATAVQQAAVPTKADKIECLVDGAMVHVIKTHLANNHPDWSLDRYKAEFPGAKTLSPYAEMIAMQKRAEEAQKVVPITSAKSAEMVYERKPMHEVFGIDPSAPAVLNKRGQPIQVSVGQPTGDGLLLVPDVDKNYIFDLELVKNVLMGFEMRINVYAWGFHGTGKTSLFEQVCARTNRPFLRIQHTANTEESHIVGQFVVQNGATIWQPGPLMDAMLNGYVYCADEYDFAMPSVLSVYQPVLEGKPLVVKDAPPEYRVIRPHKDFRICGTGNTNGSGDETGLYQGTQIQNAANYSRFGITIEVEYMEAKVETAIVASQAGLKKEDAAKIVKFAGEWREAFKAGKVSTTISPRELISAGKIGIMKGSDYGAGMQLAFINRMTRIDKKAAQEFAQRIFG